ncbi:FecR family protein [Aestuariibaculum suncheonense]|uniref:DUF4974 domain-containing protein n=1 Tax=Aestuariibaculum suncheonense TaxID=1028745 RepID=A0A8J6Q8B1_9FLAO|nr:FecR family protein [Aestuariibaculum suncheonense]MBD0835661.1 DUF4974 domain-containing protein [Aestuariibaculum suncheonense]
MSLKEIRTIIVKYLNEEATASELNQLSEWLELDNENKRIFKEYLDVYHAIHKDQVFDAIKAYNKTENVIIEKASKASKTIRLNIIRYAAAAVLILGLLGGYLFNEFLISGTRTVANEVIVSNIEPGTNKAILTLENGEEVVFVKGSSLQKNNITSNGEEIVYKANSQIKELAYNTLTIPRGGQFFIKLSDGTQVWLNSETQLKYPISFIGDAPRKVELIYGEAYFEVSPSTEHNGAKFIVSNRNQDIEVLGTKFNIQAYKEESHIYTTLSEGKVMVRSHSGKDILSPGQQASLDIENGSFSIQKVNVKHELAWIYGDFVFNKKSLDEIVKVLSRWYDVDIKLEGEYVLSQKFNGQLSRGQNLEKILELIKNTGKIKSFEINDKTVVLK